MFQSSIWQLYVPFLLDDKVDRMLILYCLKYIDAFKVFCSLTVLLNTSHMKWFITKYQSCAVNFRKTLLTHKCCFSSKRIFLPWSAADVVYQQCTCYYDLLWLICGIPRFSPHLGQQSDELMSWWSVRRPPVCLSTIYLKCFFSFHFWWI